MNKLEYLSLKGELKNWAKPKLNKLLSDMELNEEECNRVSYWYEGGTTAGVELRFYESPRTYSKKLRAVFTKIWNYKEFSLRMKKENQ